jgi:hypothetical protein
VNPREMTAAFRRPPQWALPLFTALLVTAGAQAAAAGNTDSTKAAPAQMAALRALPGSGSEVVLDRGTRGVLFIDFVEWTLYRDRNSGSPALAVRILYGDLPDEMPDSLRRIFIRHLSAENQGIVQRTYRTLRKNDLVVAACAGAGCRLVVNGREILAASGFELFGDLAHYVTGREIVTRPSPGGG